MTEVIDEIGLITVFLLVFLSAVLFSYKSENKNSNYIFAAFLLVTSIDLSALFLTSFYAEHQFFNQIRIASVLIQMPLYLLYVKSICYNNFKFKSIRLLHFVPFILFLIGFIISNLSDSLYQAYKIFSQSQYYLYILAVFYILHKYKKLHLEQSSINNETYRWLFTTSVLFLLGNTLVMTRKIAVNYLSYDGLPYLNLSISLFGLAVICWFMIKAMRNPELFGGVDQKLETKEKIREPNSPIDEKNKQFLLDYMKNEKPYLEDGLTLQELAKRIDLPEKELSVLINQKIGVRFFDFINSHRIEEAKHLLENSSLNIQEIMYDVGFNSKSSFNTAFKKHTHTTPSKYRESIS